jgi:beta-lactamase regulating signal transducer with metallopeptidase domain
MTSTVMKLLSPTVMQTLAWALLHFLWQGTALAALGAALMALARRARVRYVVGTAVLLLMFIAPIATGVLSWQPHSALAERSQPFDSAGTTSVQHRAIPSAASSSVEASSLTASSQESSPGMLPWLVEAWLVGVAFLSLRSAGGFLFLERERRRQSTVVEDRVLQMCRRLQDQLGIARAIRYCVGAWLQAPAVIGWFRPVVFLPVTALTGFSEEQLELVIAHELAHIQRFDPFVNVFQVCVETLLFYHPAVWWLNKRIRAEREHCCDDVAVALCGNAVEYARALTLMEEWRSAPVLAMAANRGPLTERVVRVLGLNTLGAGTRGIGLTGSVLCLTAALAAGNALLGMTHPAPVHAGYSVQAMPKPVSNSAQAQASQGVSTPKPSAGQSASPASSSGSYIDAMKAAGLDNLTIDELIALKTQDVTPEYARAMHELGLHPDADGLVALRVQGVTPEYIHDLRALGFTPDADEIIALKVQGVNADYVHGMKEVGIQGDADQMIALKVQGVTPDYVRGLKDVGIAGDGDAIVALKVQGVTPDYVRALRAAGVTVDSDEVIALKVQGVTPDYVHGLQALGLKPGADEIVGMRVQGVTPEYIRDIRALGLNPSADEIVGMKVQGVTTEFIKALQSAGFKPDVDDVIGAKVQGVTPEFIERARKHGFQNLTLEKLIELKRLGLLEDKADI